MLRAATKPGGLTEAEVARNEESFNLATTATWNRKASSEPFSICSKCLFFSWAISRRGVCQRLGSTVECGIMQHRMQGYRHLVKASEGEYNQIHNDT